MPQDTRDALTAAVQIAGSLHTLISRNLHPQEPAALTLGSFQAGQSHNAIPQKAVLRGNIRYFKSETRELLMNRIDEVATPTARAMGCEASTKYRTIAPPLENDAASVEIMHNAADEMGLAAVQLPKPSMATEDFARYTGRVSGAFAFIGTDEPGKTDMGEHRGLHSPHYDFNDAIIGAAVRLLSAIPWAM
jgi:hippurate hydrolase